MFARILTIALVASLALPIAGVTSPVAAKKKFKTKTVTETFTNPGTIDIPEEGNANPFPSNIEVGGFKKGQVQGVEVRLENLSHTNPDDLNIMLLAPNGRFAILLDDAGGSADATSVDLTFNDGGALIPDDGPLVSGTFRASAYDFPALSNSPYDALATFSGIDPNGTWQLFVFDDSDDDGGEGEIADGWSLEITAKVQGKKKKK
jgi:subtilisin-like proprotein convertase family protein